MLERTGQVVRHLEIAGQDVAYAAVGDGPPVVIGGWWCSHLTLNWQDSRFRAYLSRLAERHTVIRYDRPGQDASSPGGRVPVDLAQEVSVLGGLVDALELERVDVVGASSGAAVAAGYAATHPDARQHLNALRTPTTVLHRRDDRAIPFALGADVARRVRHASFVALEGEDHFPWRGDATSVTDATLRGLGHRVPPRSAAPRVEALTDRERQVLTLVADGLTDEQIGERLVLSPHTVHRHIANARMKLGVRSRAAAAAILANATRTECPA